jgi:hypothetical protein
MLEVLVQATERGLITDLAAKLDQLETTRFQIGPECKAVIQGMRERDLQRRIAQELHRKRHSPLTIHHYLPPPFGGQR